MLRARRHFAGTAPPEDAGNKVVTRDRRERVRDDDILAQLDEALGALDRELGDGRVVRCGAVEVDF